MNSGMPGLLLLVLFHSENEGPIVHIVCLQNDFEISNEALRSVERKEKRSYTREPGWVGR
jgi:hypothetical protein